MWLFNDRIKTETNDIIVFHNIGTRIFFGVVSAFSALFVFVTLEEPDSSTRLLFTFVGVSLVAGFISLVDKTVTIDKRSQSIVFQTNSPIKHFESVKKIPFSLLKEIKFSPIDTPDGLYRSVALIQYKDKRIKTAYIYYPSSEADATAVAWKFHNITSKHIVEEARRID